MRAKTKANKSKTKDMLKLLIIFVLKANWEIYGAYKVIPEAVCSGIIGTLYPEANFRGENEPNGNRNAVFAYTNAT